MFIVEPKDGATVDQTFTVKFGIEGMPLAPITEATPPVEPTPTPTPVPVDSRWMLLLTALAVALLAARQKLRPS